VEFPRGKKIYEIAKPIGYLRVSVSGKEIAFGELQALNNDVCGSWWWMPTGKR
jgi:hypothetical protein